MSAAADCLVIAGVCGTCGRKVWERVDPYDVGFFHFELLDRLTGAPCVRCRSIPAERYTLVRDER